MSRCSGKVTRLPRRGSRLVGESKFSASYGMGNVYSKAGKNLCRRKHHKSGRGERVEEGSRRTAPSFEIGTSVWSCNRGVESTTTPSGGVRYAAATMQHMHRTLQPDSLPLAQCNLVLRPVI